MAICRPTQHPARTTRSAARSAVAPMTRAAKPAHPGEGWYAPTRRNPMNSHTALISAPQPIDSARPACPRNGTSNRLSSCVSTSTAIAIFTGVRVSCGKRTGKGSSRRSADRPTPYPIRPVRLGDAWAVKAPRGTDTDTACREHQQGGQAWQCEQSTRRRTQRAARIPGRGAPLRRGELRISTTRAKRGSGRETIRRSE